jgi:hypothetical protein
MKIRPFQIMVMFSWDSSIADCRGEWAVTLPHAPPPHGKPAPLLADEPQSCKKAAGTRALPARKVYHRRGQ